MAGYGTREEVLF